MYAIVRTGGKQYRVSEGESLETERLGEPGTEVALEPVLVVDDGRVVSGAALDGVRVRATVTDEVAGPKITGFTYKAKANERRRWGHRQRHARLHIDAIEGV
ncbi:MAG: 50S ribosomal protein L21 [Acidimicrobiia bacterium]|nr:50S ribosomal protein L21 [Acidimicrobiia bacterium]